MKTTLGLRVLKNAGYDLHLYARPNNRFCFKNKIGKPKQQYLQSLFLFSKNPDTLFKTCTDYKSGDDSKTYALYDDDSLDRFIEDVPKIIKEKTNGNFFLIALDGAHAPYSFLPNKINKVFIPYFDGVVK